MYEGRAAPIKSAMEQVGNDRQANPGPLHDAANIEARAAEQVGQMGLDPAFAKFATYLTTLQMTSDHTLRNALLSTTTAVNTNTNDIAQLKKTVKEAEVCYSQVQSTQGSIFTNLAEIRAIANRSLNLASENRQRESKGNFIVSGEGIPSPAPNEDLFDIIFTMIFEKYGIWVYLQELN